MVFEKITDIRMIRSIRQQESSTVVTGSQIRLKSSEIASMIRTPLADLKIAIREQSDIPQAAISMKVESPRAMGCPDSSVRITYARII